MAVVEGIPVSEMLNRSFYEVFENGDKKWLVTYADVALNGNKHILQDYSPEIDKTLVNTDESVHTARSSSACFPVFQCTLSAA